MSTCGSKENCEAISGTTLRLRTAEGLPHVLYRIDNMDCPTEEALIRDKLSKVPGVKGLEFNLMRRTVAVRHELPSPEPLEQALSAIGMRAERVEEAPSGSSPSEARPAPISKITRTHWTLLAVSAVAASSAEIVYWLNEGNHWAVVSLALVAIFTGGLPTYQKGWIALRHGNLNMNALMSIAVTGAMLIGHWPEAAMVMVLFALAELIEGKSLDRARNAIRGLLDLAPEMATVQRDDGSWADVEVKTIDVGSRVRVKPGARIALDGELVQGHSTVDQAPITGESLPVEKVTGDPVFAGTINQSGSFEYRVTAAANQSTLARIIHAVEAAQGSRAPTQRFVDQFARLYTPIVFALALAVALLPPLVFDAPWLLWIYKALVLLVIACPCALVISTPVSIVSGLAAAARHGILIKGGVYLEEGRKLRWLALDKTGTITHGKPAQTDFVPWNGSDPATSRVIAGSLAARSDHPVSRAIAQAAAGARLELRDVADFGALPGRGVRGRIDGVAFYLGNHRMVEEMKACSPELEARLSALEAQGKTVVMLVREDRVHAVFAVADTVKESSRRAIAELHALNVGTVMLTGDNPHTAEAIAQQVGIDRARGNLLPEDKVREVEELRSEMPGGLGGKIGMVGDGINDAPALARADIGFAMGAAGTDTAIETADVALMDDDLRKLPTFVRLSQATASVLKQNIALALAIKAAFLVLTFTGQATMWMAVFADMGASLLVVGNGLRLLRK